MPTSTSEAGLEVEEEAMERVSAERRSELETGVARR
eukprot:CAMPEP_0182473570 /NCGR_PEP_ID=MMETSP1319-20130603/24152_1 /TAXON_ID=172717 /ORGANISM="Bolidomonas pacifica, Strain RCC208" /LENGTH=35 /DNA_ID= /DNA_START= /DNA_END= /DNA_ORIENTATION=